MIRSDNDPNQDRQHQLEAISKAAREAVRDALRRHMLLGESVVVSENGTVRTLSPEEIRVRLESSTN